MINSRNTNIITERKIYSRQGDIEGEIKVVATYDNHSIDDQNNLDKNMVKILLIL